MMIVTRIACALGLLLIVTPALARHKGPTAQDKLQAACYPDVQRLCKDAMPNVDKVTACMKMHKSMVSAKCNAAYKATKS